MALQSLIMPIVSLFRSAGITQARQAIGGLNKDFGSLAGSIGRASGAFAAFQGLAGARTFVIDSVEGAQRFERNMLALKQVFEGATPSLNNFTKEVESYGLSQGQAAQASVFLGSVLKQYGFSVNEASVETQKLVKLSQDLATTYGYDIQDALLSVTALFRGEYDPIEKFGVAMKQNEVNARVASKGLGDLTGEALANAQAIARLEMLYERAADSSGAFTRAGDTLYASQQRLAAIMQNTQLAFGAELQDALAAVNNIFADIADKAAPELIEIGGALSNVIENLSPTIEALAESFVNLIALLQPVTEIIGGLISLLNLGLIPALQIINGVGSNVVQFFDTWSATIGAATLQIQRLKLAMDENPLFKATIGALFGRLGATIDIVNGALTSMEDILLNTEYAARAASGEFSSFDDGAKAASVALRGSAYAARAAAKAAEEAGPAFTYFQKELETTGTYAKDAEGNLIGLADLFGDIEEAALKSDASEALKDIGFSAGQIAEILTRPDWAQIFGEISRLAKITAIDISRVTSVTGLGIIGAAQASLDELMKGLKGDGGGAGAPAKNFVKEFFDDIQAEMAKQNARLKLAGMGASTGLIESILGSEGWEKVFARVIRDGVPGLRKLQAEWNRTGAGIEEANAKQDAFRKEQERIAEGAREVAEAFIEARQKEADAAKEAYDNAVAARDAFLKSFSDTARIKFLPNFEVELGKFESSIFDTIARIREGLAGALSDSVITQKDFDALNKFVAIEETALRAIAKQRDELAERYTLSEALINDYKRAFTSALSLTSLFGRISDKAEKTTVQEVSKGVLTLGKNLREFGITVTRSFEKTVESVTDKSAGLLNGFREMAVKARAFAQNLRTLKQMGLDPMLFNQLVEAGVEAGGATAQALVDGGSDTITEINSLFKEINDLGAGLGEEAAAKLYGSGINMANGLLEGIRSKQNELETLARTFADAFNTEFSNRINVAVNVPVQAAGAVSAAAAAAVPKLDDLDMAGLTKIRGLIENAQAWLGKNLSAFEQIRAMDILDIYKGIEQDLLNRRMVDVSGIRSGMSVSDLAEAAIKGGATSVNNYYIEVKTDATQSNAIIGKTIDNVIKTYTRTGGGGGGGAQVAL